MVAKNMYFGNCGRQVRDSRALVAGFELAAAYSIYWDGIGMVPRKKEEEEKQKKKKKKWYQEQGGAFENTL